MFKVPDHITICKSLEQIAFQQPIELNIAFIGVAFREISE
jgi:hypothetical protein